MATQKARSAKSRASRKGQVSAGRIRLVSAQLERERGARFQVRIELEWLGQSFVAEGPGVGQDDMAARLAAEFTIEALAITGKSPPFRLVGLKRIRAFDSEVVMVCLDDPAQAGQKFIGAVAVRETLVKGAASAVLDAVNRVLLFSPASASANEEANLKAVS